MRISLRLPVAAGLAAGLTFTACSPRSGVQPITPAQRPVPPTPGPPPTYDFPDVQRHTLSNGLQVWLVERPDAPLVALQMLVEAGAVADPPASPGLASLTAAMLREGSARRSALQIADEIDYLAASLTTSAGQEIAQISLNVLSRNLEPALDVFADVLTSPAFPAAAWDRLRQERLASILQSRDQATSLATQEFARRLFGTEHPYGRPVMGTAEAVRALEIRHLEEFYRTHYRPTNAHLIAVGGVSSAHLIPLLERALAGWPPGPVPERPRPADPAPQLETRIYLIDKPDAAQSEIRIGHVGVPRTHRDYFPLLVMNTILGGQFTSRINLNLREEKGYTYGARSAFQMSRMAGPFIASGGVQTAVTRESLIEFMRELEDIRGPRAATDEEVEFARTSIIRREPLGLETNAQIAGRIQDLILYDLPLDYFDDYNSRIAEVTVADVQRVAREYLQPERFAIIVVGDRALIEDGLVSLPYPMEVVELEAVTN